MSESERMPGNETGPRCHHGLAPFENGETFAGAKALEMAGSANTRQAGTDDQDIQMFHGHGARSRNSGNEHHLSPCARHSNVGVTERLMRRAADTV